MRILILATLLFFIHIPTRSQEWIQRDTCHSVFYTMVNDSIYQKINGYVIQETRLYPDYWGWKKKKKIYFVNSQFCSIEKFDFYKQKRPFIDF